MIPPKYNYQAIPPAATAIETGYLSQAALRESTDLAVTSVNPLMLKLSLVQEEAAQDPSFPLYG